MNPSGENPGSEENPYVINDVNDWNTLADDVNGGYSYDGKFLKLTDNIPVTIDNTDNSDKMVGVGIGNTESNWFSGTFDGDGHTLTFNAGTTTTAYSPATNAPTAPFRIIDGATIKNLTVTGTIVSDKKYNSGLIGFAYNTQSGNENYIISCTSDIFVDCSNISGNNPDCSSAGFLAENKNGKIHFTYCIFTGTIDKGSNTGTQKSAGFVSYNGGTSASFTNCTMAGTITIESNIATFNRNGKDSYSKAYYITNYSGSSPQGTPATTTAPTDEIAKIYTVSATNYYVPGAEITGMATTYSYIEGSPVEITPVVTYYGKTLARGIDYIIKVDGTEVPTETTPTLSTAGDHIVTIEGKTGSSYAGSQTKTIHVVSYNTWDLVKEILADDSEGDRNITLSGNITPTDPTADDLALVVHGNVTLNLNGHTIDRGLYFYEAHTTYAYRSVLNGQVLIIPAGASLTIYGNDGIIKGGNNKWEEGIESYKDGGGIYNMGTLVLNNVNVEYNYCFRETEVTTSATARGGGIYTGSGSSFTMTGGSISSNEGKGGGGGIYCANAAVFVMNNVEIESNHCESKGAGVRVLTSESKTAYLRGCTIQANYLTIDTEAKGGGIYMESGNLDMTNCDIVGNSSFKQGSGFYSKKGTTTATNCNIYWNGSNHFSDDDLGAGVYLYDKGSDHSIFIMDGGSIYENNSIGNGGGIYVEQGAVFQVKGNVIIKDNYMAAVGSGSTDNNVYLDGTSVIEVIGALGEDAEIIITPHGEGGNYVKFTGVESDMSHFKLDNNGDDYEYNMLINSSGYIEVYEAYSWNSEATWDGTIATITEGSYPPTTANDVTINRAVKIPSNCVAYAKDITFGTYGSIIIEDGGQLINNNSVAVVAKKNVVAANAEAQAGWYLISSPVNNPAIAGETPATNLITTGSQKYDLYRFNESAELQWENYRASHADFTTLENGRGYLYRNSKDHTIDIGGTLNVSDITYTLSCSGSELTGFNLIGNPYSHNIYKNDEYQDEGDTPAINDAVLAVGYYVLNSAADAFEAKIGYNNPIKPCDAILVQTTSAHDLVITNTINPAAVYVEPESGEKRKSGYENIMFEIANNEHRDVAYAMFIDGAGLNKIEHMNADVPMLYIHQYDEDYAIATMNDDVKAFNLNFKAMTMGEYTLSVKPQGEFGYIHLYDKLTGEDIDMLLENEYTFIGSNGDNADRFIVRLGTTNGDADDNESFVWQNGNDIIVAGEGELQVFDVMGRMVATQHVNGVQTVEKPSSCGVYIFRLEGKAQKIVIR